MSRIEAYGLGPTPPLRHRSRGDHAFAANVLRGLANRASIGLWGTLLLGPVLFAWGVYLHWRKRRELRRLD